MQCVAASIHAFARTSGRTGAAMALAPITMISKNIIIATVNEMETGINSQRFKISWAFLVGQNRETIYKWWIRGLTSSKRTPVMSSEEDESSSWLDSRRRRFERELSSDDDEDGG